MKTSSRAAMLVLMASVALHSGCQSCKQENQSPQTRKAAPAVLAGLDAVPADVQVVLGADVAKLRDSWLVQRAIEQMFKRDPELATRIRQLIDSCQLDPARDIHGVIIALSRGGGDSAGSDEALMVLTGTFVEARLASCVGQSSAAAGSAVTVKEVEGRVFYKVDGKQDVWFTLTGPTTLVVATALEQLTRAAGDSDKIASSQVMAPLLARVDQSVGLWGAGLLDPRIGAGLVEQTGGKVAAPPRAVFVELDLERGLTLALGAEMTTVDDSNALLSLIKEQISIGSWALESYGLAAAADKLGVDLQGKTVYLRMSLTEDEIKEVLSRIDSSGRSEQDPPKPEE